MAAAARLKDPHICPLSTGPVPHLGGPIIGPGAPTVLIEGRPAAVVGDNCRCEVGMTTIVGGSSTVFICGKPAARVGDTTNHGGKIGSGSLSVLIGE